MLARKKRVTVLDLMVAGILMGAGFPRPASAHDGYGTRKHPLEGQRYETMRGLAEYLDQATRAAVDGANRVSAEGRPSQIKLLSSIRLFGYHADAFHRMMGDYQASLFDVPSLVEDLSKQARAVNGRIRSARALEGTYPEWDAVLDGLKRMKQVLAGRDAEVPAPPVEWRLEDDVAGSGHGWLSTLSVERLDEFRQLARRLDESAKRAHDGAKHTLRQYPDGGQQSLDGLRHVVKQTRSLRGRAARGPVDPRLVGPIVNELLEDARRTNRGMRDGQTFRQVWPEWDRALGLLERMDRLVRS